MCSPRSAQWRRGLDGGSEELAIYEAIFSREARLITPFVVLTKVRIPGKTG